MIDDLDYSRTALGNASAWARNAHRPDLALAQIREAGAALKRAERVLVRYAPPDPT